MTVILQPKAAEVSSASHSCPRHPALALKIFPEKGRGVVATEFIPNGTLLEVAPVLRLTKEETGHIANTLLDTYVFDWQEPPYDSAVVLGLIFLANHSAKHPNAKFERDFDAQTMSLISIRDIHEGDEITHDYNCDLWFEVKE